jgi:hypothetical protein
MLGPRGNPQARNLFEIVKYLQESEGVKGNDKVERRVTARLGEFDRHDLSQEIDEVS